jgi:hypothetical protein
LTSLAFALLYAELGLFAHQAWRTRSDSEAGLIIAAAFALMLIAYMGSFWPARAYTVSGVERQGSLVLPTLVAQMGQGAGIIVAASVPCLLMYLYLVGFDLVAATTLLDNIYVLTLAGAGMLHLLVGYVRYGALLYAVKQDSYVKVLTVSGGLGVLIFAAFVFLFGLDSAWASQAPAAQRGLYSLHVYGRDLFFFTLMLAIYAWHARWMADH